MCLVPSHVALLRGINVGRGKRLAMADLRAAVAGLGHTDVATYIASGNVVFTARGAARADDLEKAIEAATGVGCAVIVLPRKRLQEAVAGNPYPQVTEPKHLHVGFAVKAVPAAGIDAAIERASARNSEDTATVVDGVLYMHTPDGLGRSVLAEELTRGKALATVTMRNWATVSKLVAMLES